MPVCRRLWTGKWQLVSSVGTLGWNLVHESQYSLIHHPVIPVAHPLCHPISHHLIQIPNIPSKILSSVSPSFVLFVRSSCTVQPLWEHSLNAGYACYCSRFMSHSVVGLLLARAVVISPRNRTLLYWGESSFLRILHLLAHFTLGDYRRRSRHKLKSTKTHLLVNTA